MELFFTPHFLETMYTHFDQQIQLYKHDKVRRAYLMKCQECYRAMHQLLVPFSTYAEQLGLTQTTK